MSGSLNMSNKHDSNKFNESQRPEKEKEDPFNKWQKISEQSHQTNQENRLEIKIGGKDSEDEVTEDQEKEGIEFSSRTQLEDQLTTLEMKCEEYKNQVSRVQAEMANIHKRTSRDVENAYKYGNEKLINALLPIADSLTRALEGADLNHDSKSRAMQKGISLTLELLHGTLNKFGVTVIDPPMGSDFDPHLHEAVSAQPSDNLKPNSILQVLQKGYQLNERILRAAMVVVSQ